MNKLVASHSVYNIFTALLDSQTPKYDTNKILFTEAVTSNFFTSIPL